MNFIARLKTLVEQNAAQFFQFALVGVLNTAVDFSVFVFLNKIIIIHYIYCQIAGYSAGILNSFLWNKYWTFNKGQKHQKLFSQFGKFMFVNGVSLLSTLIGLAILIDFFNMSVILAKIAILVISQLINFLGYKFLVFKYN